MKKRLMMALAVGALMAAILPGAVAGASVACGDVVTTDIKLTHDLGPCPTATDGLIAGASGILIDLNGHTISGALGSYSGVRIDPLRLGVVVRDVEVRNGTITGFKQGVVLAQTSGNHVWRLRLVENERGIDLGGGNSGNLIEKNAAIDNISDAIRVDGSSHNTIQKNAVVGSPYGISISNGANDNVITKNEVADSVRSPGLGIAVWGGSNGNVIEDNRVTGMADAGIYVDASDESLVSKNLSSRNGGDGIIVKGVSVGTVVVKNTASRNGDDGIDVVASTTLTKNKANDNADLGIDAAGGVTDGGGNKASGNGGPVECANVVCG